MRQREMMINDVLAQDPDIETVVAFIGGGPGSSATNTGTVIITLKPKPPRRVTADQIINRLRPKMARLEGGSLFLQAAQDLRLGGRCDPNHYQYPLHQSD